MGSLRIGLDGSLRISLVDSLRMNLDGSLRMSLVFLELGFDSLRILDSDSLRILVFGSLRILGLDSLRILRLRGQDFATGKNFSFNQCHTKRFCVFFSGKLFYKSNRNLFSCVCIT